MTFLQENYLCFIQMFSKSKILIQKYKKSELIKETGNCIFQII